MPNDPLKPIEEIEEAIYLALIAEVPDIMPVVARSLAKTAAERIRAQRKFVTAEQIKCLNNPRQFPDENQKENNENDKQQ